MKIHKMKTLEMNWWLIEINTLWFFCFCWKTHFTFYYFLFFEDWKNYLSSNDDDDFFCSTKDPGTPFYIPSKKSDHQKNRKLFSRFTCHCETKHDPLAKKKECIIMIWTNKQTKQKKREQFRPIYLSILFFVWIHWLSR